VLLSHCIAAAQLTNSCVSNAFCCPHCFATHTQQSNPTLLSSLLATLFALLLFDNATSQTANQWAVTRPILSLLLADEAVSVSYAHHVAVQLYSSEAIAC
jgi:hypothetical protein